MRALAFSSRAHHGRKADERRLGCELGALLQIGQVLSHVVDLFFVFPNRLLKFFDGARAVVGLQLLQGLPLFLQLFLTALRER